MTGFWKFHFGSRAGPYAFVLSPVCCKSVYVFWSIAKVGIVSLLIDPYVETRWDDSA